MVPVYVNLCLRSLVAFRKGAFSFLFLFFLFVLLSFQTKVFLYPHYLTQRSRSAKPRAFFSLHSDINECTTNAHNCDVKAFCNTTEGSFNCTCSPGYTGNRMKCTGKLSFLMEKQNIDNYNEVRNNPKVLLYPHYLTVEAGLQKLEHSFLSIQILTSVRLTFITVMSKLSVITLRDPLIAHAALDTLEMEHHAPVYI